MTSIIESAYKLLEDLGIRYVVFNRDHLELQYNFPNQQITAFGKTEEEVVENFYHLYQILTNPA